MKKFILVLAVTLFLLSLTSCNTVKSTTKLSTSINTKINIISEAKITDREKMFLSIGNDKYFAFDFNIATKYKWLEVWVDRYELGKKILSTGKLSTSLSIGKKGMIIAAVNGLDKMKQNWTLVANKGGATITTKFTPDYKALKNSSIMSGTNNSENIPISDNEITLAYVCCQVNGDSMNSLSNKFFSNPEGNTKEIKSYDLVYLLKCKFYENAQ